MRINGAFFSFNLEPETEKLHVESNLTKEVKEMYKLASDPSDGDLDLALPWDPVSKDIHLTHKMTSIEKFSDTEKKKNAKLIQNLEKIEKIEYFQGKNMS